MIWISACVLFVILLANAKSESSFVFELPKGTTAVAEGSKTEGDECDASSLTTILCENDSLKFCGPDNRIMLLPCTINGRQGFCNCEKTACVPKKPVCSEVKSKCYQTNIKLPDNLDCHKFSYCDENMDKITLQCPGNLIYDPKEQKCTDRSTARCNKIVCPRPGNTLQLIPFPQAKNYFVLCYKGMGDVRKCSDRYYTVRNNGPQAPLQSCQFDCGLLRASGTFKDTNLERCQKGIFYACSKSGTNFITVQAKCPEGLTFDENMGICTKKDNCIEPEKL